MKDVLQVPSASDVKASTLSLQVKSPLLNNKLLGVWAPLVRNGQRVGGKALAAELLETPYTTSIARPGARQLGPTTGYGTFDAHFHPNEPIVMTIMGATLELRASRENGVQELGLINNAEPLVIGNITYLSDYLLVMGNEVGSVRECWTRAEPIKSVSKEEAARIRMGVKATVEREPVKIP